MTMHRPLTALAVTAVLLTALTACSVNVVDTTRPNTSASDTDALPENTDQAEEPNAGEHPDAADGIDRETLIAAATTIRTCDGELTINDDAVLVRVEGACDHLVLNTHASQIVTDDVAHLEVIGDSNVVVSGAVDTMLVNGSSNVVQWQGATPTMTENGSANVLTAG